MSGGLRPNITSKGVNPVEALTEVLKLHSAKERNFPQSEGLWWTKQRRYCCKTLMVTSV
ncbi:hypothetical protein Fmac_020495 [Flemingia macrophylla]|uniref:Uncharacterized protein n=1 Tax=Flemingia macrophylla TaxID=520843 RepID=A0ABD1LU90_9FABA